MSNIENVNNSSLVFSFYKDKISTNPADIVLNDSAIKIDLEMAKAIANGEYNITLDEYNAMNFYKVQMGSFFDEEKNFKITINNNSEKINKTDDKTDSENLTSNDKFEITLEDYTSLNSYETVMNSLLKGNSTNNLPSFLNNFLGNKTDEIINAKSFIDNMKDLGVSTDKAVKIYGAMKSYSVTASLIQNNKNNFVNAKI